ncbi:MAG TPA: GNAT family N-acetyltransferase [Steroidobacteraceae bacterium]
MSATLRQAVRSDLPDLFRVRHAVSEKHFLVSIPEDQVVEALETTGRGWVIELDGVIVAFAIGNALTGSIWALFVDPPYRGNGYGRRLYDTVVEWLWSQGHDRVWLNAQPETSP